MRAAAPDLSLLYGDLALETEWSEVYALIFGFEPFCPEPIAKGSG